MAYSKETVNKVIELRRKNHTAREISNILGGYPDEAAVRRLCSVHNIRKADNKIELIKKWTDTERAYIAGIIDGEGSIIIGKLKPGGKKGKNYSYQLYMKVVNTDKVLIEWLSEKTLTNFSKNKRKNKKYRITYEIHWPVNITIAILESIYPFMLIKQDQVDLAKKFRKSFENQKTGKSATKKNG
jgi:hypothetical protein